MIVEYTRYKIDERRRTTFEKAYKKAVESLAASSHCLAYEFSHCTAQGEISRCHQWAFGIVFGAEKTTGFGPYFSEAVSEYEKAVELNPTKESP